jgi:hypothetical protein
MQAMVDRGWHVHSCERAIWPSSAIPCGGVPRPDKPDQPRGIADGGAPRKELIDSCGVPVRSINDMTGLKEMDEIPPLPPEGASEGAPPELPPQSTFAYADQHRKVMEEMQFLRRWAQEWKPSHLDVARNSLILAQAAALMGGFVVGFVCDFWRYFHQFSYATWMLPFTMIMWGSMTTVETDKLNWILSKCMDMGVSAASGIAQRFADHVCDQFQAMMDDWEDTWWKTCTNEELLKWRQQRIELGKVTKKREDRLVHVLVYTDDPKIDCASNEHCIAALQIWRIVTRSWNVILASIDKCSIGAANKWCGMLHYSCFALAVMPMSK